MTTRQPTHPTHPTRSHIDDIIGLIDTVLGPDDGAPAPTHADMELGYGSSLIGMHHHIPEPAPAPPPTPSRVPRISGRLLSSIYSYRHLA